MEKISIIIPVYNASKYIEKCLYSIEQQTYKNLEIILVDDGSTDDSLDKCKQYSKRFHNIKILTQENRGSSVARNKGVKNATGTLFIFVDADDQLTPSAIEDLYYCVKKYNADVVVGTVNRIGEPTKDSIVVDSNFALKMCLSQKKMIKGMPDFIKMINPGSPWMKLIKRELFLDEIELFSENIKMHHEDTLFCFKLYGKANTIIYTDSSPYLYNINVPGSLCKRFFYSKIEESILLLNLMYHSIDESYYLSQKEKEELKKEFGREIILECWADYFTHKDNKSRLIDEREKLILFYNSQEVHNIREKLDRKDLKLLQILVIYLLQKKQMVLLALLAKAIRTIKRIVYKE